MRRRKFWLASALLAVVLLFAACGAKEDDGEIYELPPEPPDGTLIYAALNPTEGSTQKRVDAFNESHTDVQIEIRDYSDENGPQRLMVELAAGRVPDIMELQRVGEGRYADWGATFMPTEDRPEGEFFMPYRRLAQAGYLEDLWPYIDNDPELGRENILEAPLKATEVDGGLYMIFRNVTLTTMIVPEELAGDVYGWTLDELMEAFSTLPDGSTILPFDTTRRQAYSRLFRAAMDQYVDWNEGTCSFDSEQFRAVLEFLKTFPEEFETTLSSNDIQVEREWRRIDGEQLLEPVTISSPSTIPYIDTYFGEGGRVACVGYPTADGSSGNFFNPHGPKLAMSSACKDKDAAWEFMRYLIAETYAPGVMRKLLNSGELSYAIHINRQNYDQIIRRNMSKNEPRVSFRDTYKNGPIFYMRNDGCPDNSDLERFETIIEHTTQIYWPDDALSELVWEVCGAYFAGDKTLDETIRLLNNRVSLYVNEQK